MFIALLIVGWLKENRKGKKNSILFYECFCLPFSFFFSVLKLLIFSSSLLSLSLFSSSTDNKEYYGGNTRTEGSTRSDEGYHSNCGPDDASTPPEDSSDSDSDNNYVLDFSVKSKRADKDRNKINKVSIWFMKKFNSKQLNNQFLSVSLSLSLLI